MRPVCCICTGRHHPANCVQAHAIFDQCAEPTPDDYAGPVVITASLREVIVVDLDAYRRRLEAEKKRRWRRGRCERVG